MKKKSIEELLMSLGPAEAEAGSPGFEGYAAEGESEDGAIGGVSAAERLGRALLERFGGAPEGATEDDLVDAILENWGMPEEDAPADDDEDDDDGEDGDYGGDEDNSGDDDYEDDEDEELPTDDEGPFGAQVRRPVPMRTGSQASSPLDYSEMSRKQFNEIRKLIKKASSDGKRIRL